MPKCKEKAQGDSVYGLQRTGTFTHSHAQRVSSTAMIMLERDGRLMATGHHL